MQLLFLLLLLVVPFLVLTLVNRFTGFRISSRTRARVGLSLFFLFTSVGHFIKTEEMSAMLPPTIPYRVELIYLTGVLEFLGPSVCGFRGLMRLTGVCLILMLIGVSAVQHLFGNQSCRVRRTWSRSGLSVSQSAVPVIRDLVGLISLPTSIGFRRQ